MISMSIFTVFFPCGFSLAVTERNMSKMDPINEPDLCFGFIFLELGINSGEHGKAIITQKLLNS